MKKKKQLNEYMLSDIAGKSAGILSGLAIGGGVLAGGIALGLHIDGNSLETRTQRAYESLYTEERSDFELAFVAQRLLGQIDENASFEDTWAQFAQETGDNRQARATDQTPRAAGATAGLSFLGLFGGPIAGVPAGFGIGGAVDGKVEKGIRKINDRRREQEEIEK